MIANLMLMMMLESPEVSCPVTTRHHYDSRRTCIYKSHDAARCRLLNRSKFYTNPGCDALLMPVERPIDDDHPSQIACRRS